MYFGIALGRELRAVVEGGKPREAALRDYGAFSASHRWKFESMLRAQRAVPKIPPRALACAMHGMATDAFVRWSFTHYLNVAPPEFARAGDARGARQPALQAAA